MDDGYPSDWGSRRKRVYKRDNYRCQKCGAKGGQLGNTQLHAHHKTPKSKGGSHQLSNLTTVCKSCHENIHGHPIGGQPTTEETNEIDPVAATLTVLTIGIISFLMITYGAVQQTLPAGQTVSEEYVTEYVSVTDDPAGTGSEYDYNVGPPLRIEFQVADNVISENGQTELTVTVSNPSRNQLRGHVDIIARSSSSPTDRGVISTVNFDLSANEKVTKTMELAGKPLIGDFGTNPRTVTFNADGQIFTDPYRAIDTDRVSPRGEEMQLTVRKPFFSRLGVYWLGFLSLFGCGLGYLFWKHRDPAGLMTRIKR